MMVQGTVQDNTGPNSGKPIAGARGSYKVTNGLGPTACSKQTAPHLLRSAMLLSPPQSPSLHAT